MSKRSYCNLHVDISVDERLAEIDDAARLFYTWVQPHCDAHGCIELHASRLRARVWPQLRKTDADTRAAIEACVRAGVLEHHRNPNTKAEWLAFPQADWELYGGANTPHSKRGKARFECSRATLVSLQKAKSARSSRENSRVLPTIPDHSSEQEQEQEQNRKESSAIAPAPPNPSPTSEPAPQPVVEPFPDPVTLSRAAGKLVDQALAGAATHAPFAPAASEPAPIATHPEPRAPIPTACAAADTAKADPKPETHAGTLGTARTNGNGVHKPRAAPSNVPNSPHHAFMHWFVDTWREHTKDVEHPAGREYVVDGGKDGSQVKAILQFARGDVDEAKRVTLVIFADPFWSNAGIDLSVVRAQFRKFQGRKPVQASGRASGSKSSLLADGTRPGEYPEPVKNMPKVLRVATA